MQSHSSSLDTLKDNLLRAVDAEYNVIKAEIVLDVICQLEKMNITKDQLQATRLGWEINTIRQKIDVRKKNVQSQLIIEIAQRAKKLLRSWQGLLNTSSTLPPIINVDNKPRLILKVKFNSSHTKRKRDSDNRTNVKRKKTQIIEINNNNSLPRLKTTQQLLLEMQMNESNVRGTQLSNGNGDSMHYKKQLSPTNWENGSSAGSPISPLSSSSSSTSWPLPPIIPDPASLESKDNENSSNLATICASYNTVSDLIQAHRRRIFASHDSRELEAKPNLLLVPIDQLAFVYEREKLNQLPQPSYSHHSSLITTEKLDQSSNFLALPYIDCPMEFDLVLDELVVQHSSINM